MAFWFGSSSGVAIGSSSLSIEEQKYLPVFDEEIDVEYLDQLLPSFYRSLMSEKEIFVSVWNSMVPALSAELLNLWHVDYAKSLVDMPIFTQRKWVKLDLVEDQDFDTDPSLTTEGRSVEAVTGTSVFSVDEENDVFKAIWSNRGSTDRAFSALRGAATEACSLEWSFKLNIADVEKYGCSFVGYMNTEATSVAAPSSSLRNALLGGVIANATGVELIALHAAYSSDLTTARSSVSLTASENYRIECSYTARTTDLVASAVALTYEKLPASTSTTAADTTGDYYTNEIKNDGYYISASTATYYYVMSSSESSIVEGSVISSSTYTAAVASFSSSAFTVATLSEGYVITAGMYEEAVREFGESVFTVTEVNFVDIGITTADKVLYGDFEHEILNVQSDRIYTSLDLLPAGGEIYYTIVGEKVVASVSVNLKADAGDNAFEVDCFGTSNIDFNNAAEVLVPVESGESSADYLTRRATELPTAQSAKLTGTTTDWSYVDPTSAYGIVYLPRIQDTITDPSTFLYEGVDYSLGQDGTLVQFQEPPPTVMYAEYVAYDEQKLYNNFGHFVNLGSDEISSESLRAKIRALFYAYFRGPTINSIRTGVQIHLGLPIAEKAGTVEAINEAYSGEYGQLVVAGKSYLYPLAVGASVSVGDTVEQFQTLSSGVEVIDYVNSPQWIDYFSGEPLEIHKYHQFLVQMNLDAFNVEDLTDAAAFVDVIKPTWKGARFLAYKDLEDDQEVDDALLVAPTLNIYEEFWTESNPLYSGRFFGPTPPASSSADPSLGEPEGEYDWSFDSGLAEYDTPALAMARTAELYTKNFAWRDTADESKFLSGHGTIYEGHNRPTPGGVEVEYSGDSLGVRSYVEGGDLVAELGVVVAETASVSIAFVSVPSGSSATSAAQITFTGTTFTTSTSSNYILTSSAGAVSDAPIWPAAIALKWSDTSDWLSDGVEGTGYQYATVPVISVPSATEIVVDITGVSPSGTVVAEVRRGGPTGTIVSNGDLSDANGGTFSTGFFAVSTGLPDFTSADSHGVNLSGVTLETGSLLRTFPNDKVYLAVRSTSSSSEEYASEFSYSDWYIFEVEGIHKTQDDKLYFVGAPASHGASTVLDLEWVLFINPDRRITLHRQESGSVLKPVLSSTESETTTLSSLTTPGTSVEAPEELSFTGMVLIQLSGDPPHLRPTNISDSRDLLSLSVKEGYVVVISDATEPEFNGEYTVDFVFAKTISVTDWAIIQLKGTSWSQALFASGSLPYATEATATITIRRRPFQTVGTEGEWKIQTEDDEFTVTTSTSPEELAVSGDTLEVDRPFTSSDDLGSWHAYQINPSVWATVPFVHDAEYASLAERFAGLGGKTTMSSSLWSVTPGGLVEMNYGREYVNFRMAVIDNDYFRTHMDYWFEVDPEELVSLQFATSPGAGDRTFRVGYTRRFEGGEGGIGWHFWGFGGDGYKCAEAPSLVIPLFGNVLCSGDSGGGAGTAPTKATSSDSSATEYYIFEDLNAGFTADISDVDSNNQPNNATFVCITEDTSIGEKLWEDWVSRTVPGGVGSGPADGTLSARYFTLQVIEVLSNTRVLLRFYGSGENGEHVSSIYPHWFQATGHLRYLIRDSQSVADDGFMLSPYGVWYAFTGYTSGVPVASYDDSGLPGSLQSGLPNATVVGLSTSYSLTLQSAVTEGFKARRTTESWYCPYFFTASLVNGSATITLSDIADFNQLSKEDIPDGCYLQVAPTMFTTLSTTDPTGMIADGPVFKADVTRAEDATGLITALGGTPTATFNITIDATAAGGISTTVTGIVIGSTVSDTRHNIIVALSPVAAVRAIEPSPDVTGVVQISSQVGGAIGNSITMSCTASTSDITIDSPLSSGADAAVAVSGGTYSGVNATDSYVVLRSTVSPFTSEPLLSLDLTDWYTRSSGDSSTLEITERVPDDETSS